VWRQIRGGGGVGGGSGGGGVVVVKAVVVLKNFETKTLPGVWVSGCW
jgi:hypothetical protein